MKKDTPIFLLHGLGARPFTLLPLAFFLRLCGWTTIHRPYYPASALYFDESVEYVNREMEKLESKEREIIVIGQSMGGLVANFLHRKGWKIRMAIYVGAPLHGARLLNKLEDVLPSWLSNLLYKKPYDFLKLCETSEPPNHPYHSIGISLPFSSDFDGKVYRDEAMLERERHTQLGWSEHSLAVVDPRLWVIVAGLLK